MKLYEWVISLFLIGLGIMSMAMCGTFYKMTQGAFWISFSKTLLEVCIWIGIPIGIIYLVWFMIRKYKKGE